MRGSQLNLYFFLNRRNEKANKNSHIQLEESRVKTQSHRLV